LCSREAEQEYVLMAARKDAPPFVGVSTVTRKLLQLVDTVARSDCSVLIEGESGTGKELVARRLHARSPRAEKPFIPINSASISEGLFESQLFGHERGAFTGAERPTLGLARCADGGTLFLDEIGEIPLSLQPKLLRLLQEGELIPVGSSECVYVDTRFLAATNRNLQDDAAEGRFREDLFYRLSVMRIYIPPLRERPDDIEPLFDHFLGDCAARYARPPIRVDAGVRDMLREHRWPGNVRELSSWVERLYITGIDPRLLAYSLMIEAGRAAASKRKKPITLEQVEREAIRHALSQTNNNRSKAAELLNIHRGTLARKMRQYDLA